MPNPKNKYKSKGKKRRAGRCLKGKKRLGSGRSVSTEKLKFT